MSTPIRTSPIKGVLVEYGFSLPPVWFMFQYNPVSLSRSRTASFEAAGKAASSGETGCRNKSEAQERSALAKVSVSSEQIGLSLTLDASDDLDEGQPVTKLFGVNSRLAALELMLYPKTDQLFGFPIGDLLGGKDQFGAASTPTIPILLFVWGYKRVLPVVMTSLSITEQEFFPDLTAKRATADISLSVLEGFNPPYLYSHGWRLTLSAANLAGDIIDVF